MLEYSGELFSLHSSNMCSVLETVTPQTELLKVYMCFLPAVKAVEFLVIIFY